MTTDQTGAASLARPREPIQAQIAKGLTLLALLAVSACSTTQTTGEASAGRPATMFPVSAEQAKTIMATAISQTFAGSAISPVELPHQGYRISLRFLLDSHDIVAYMIPAKGRTPSGQVVPGFAFEVDASGTMAIQGTVRASGLFDRIRKEAEKVASPLPIDSARWALLQR